MSAVSGITPAVAAPFTPSVVKTNAEKEAELKAAATSTSTKASSTGAAAAGSSDQGAAQKASAAEIKAAVNFSTNSALFNAMGLNGAEEGSTENIFSMGSAMSIMNSNAGAAGFITGEGEVATRAGFQPDTVKTQRTQGDIEALKKAQDLLKTPAKGSALDITA